ncbi:IS66 family insertion sequence element accessory protein TnpB [Rhizobium leguminosarum]|uniref:IS66 family insertion sequence element accessory protein TnpB n=1 Tax=Rhizobium leguminosarum TaxID=384 RepID=UPI003D7C3015
MVATKPVDFRKVHDGLAALVTNELHKDPFTGTVFAFRSRKADRLKLLYFDSGHLSNFGSERCSGICTLLCKHLVRLGELARPGRLFRVRRSRRT